MRNKCTAFALCSTLLFSGSFERVRAAAESPFHDRPASPRSLPADNLPPFGMLDDNGNLVPRPPMPAGALHRGPGAEAESTAPGPSLSQAIEAARAAVDTCAASGYRVGAAVTGRRRPRLRSPPGTGRQRHRRRAHLMAWGGGGGMMGGYGGGGFARAMEMGMGMSLGANLLGGIFR